MGSVSINRSGVGLIEIIDPAKVMQHQAYFWFSIKYIDHLLDFFRMLKVILIAKKYQVLCAMADGLFKIFDVTQIFVISMNAHI